MGNEQNYHVHRLHRYIERDEQKLSFDLLPEVIEKEKVAEEKDIISISGVAKNEVVVQDIETEIISINETPATKDRMAGMVENNIVPSKDEVGKRDKSFLQKISESINSSLLDTGNELETLDIPITISRIITHSGVSERSQYFVEWSSGERSGVEEDDMNCPELLVKFTKDNARYCQYPN